MKIETRTIQNEQYKITYTIHYKKVKNITLRILEQSQIVVSASEYVPLSKIDEFVLEKVKWIIKNQQHQAQKINRLYGGVQDRFIYIYDKKYTITCFKSHTNSVVIEEDRLVVHYKENNQIEKNIIQYLGKRCAQDFDECLQKYYEPLAIYGFTRPQLKIRTMKARWGSCMPSKSIITLNTRLIHYPKAFLEYVALHELVHMIQPNHSDKFYRIIENYMPDYKLRMKLVTLED